MTSEPRKLAGGRASKTVTHRVICARTFGTATAYLINLDEDGNGTIHAKEPVRHEAGGSGGETAKPLTIANLLSQGAMDRSCLVCGNDEIVICTGCGTTSCGTNGLPWTCPTCHDRHDRLNLLRTASLHVAEREGRTALTHAKNGKARISAASQAAFPPPTVKRLPKEP